MALNKLIKRIYKLFGFKYKIMWMKTEWKASKFQKTVMTKVSIDNPLNGDELNKRIRPTWMWCWDTDSLRIKYTKSSAGLHKLITIHGTKDYYNKKLIENHFNTL